MNRKNRLLAVVLCAMLLFSGSRDAKLYAAEISAVSMNAGSELLTGADSSSENAEEESSESQETESAKQDSENSDSAEIQEETDTDAAVSDDRQTETETVDSAEAEESESVLEAELDTEQSEETETEEVQPAAEESAEETENQEEESLDMEQTLVPDIWASDAEITAEEEQAPGAAASGAGLPSVSYIKSTQSMDTNYALAYAFRSGLTTVDKSRTNGFSWSGSAFYNSIMSSYERDNVADWDYNKILLKINKWDEKYRNQYYVTYTNVADYQGQKLDLKVTVVSWAGYNENVKDSAGNTVKPWLGFNTDKINVSFLGIARVRLRFELVYSGTDTRANVGAHTTMRDVDAGQSLWFSSASNVSSIYLLKGNSYIKKSVDASPEPEHLTLTGGSRGDDKKPGDVNGWVQVNFNGYFETYFSEHDEWADLTDTSNFIHLDATPKTIGQYDIPDPEKRVGAQGQSYGDMTEHNSRETAYSSQAGGTVSYVIAQTVYPGTYSSFTVQDTLDSCLTYSSASVTTAGGSDASGWFTIVHDAGTNTVTFTAKDMSQEYMINDVTFYFTIYASVKDAKTIGSHGHNQDSAEWYIENQAVRTLNSNVKNTNTVFISGLMSGTYYVKKVDAENSSVIAEAAVFELQEWDKNTGQYVRVGNLTRDEGTLLYTTGELKRSAANEGKFRIVETGAPKRYKGGWSREISLESDAGGSVFAAENERDILPAGEITVIKRILESDIIWAHGNPVFRFTVCGTDEKGRNYTFEDYVEFTQDNYSVEDGYAVLSCMFQNVPVGKYTVSEKETLRYRLENIQPNTSNVSVSGSSGEVTLTKENNQASLTFQNVKTRFDRLSHTDVLTNTVPVNINIW